MHVCNRICAWVCLWDYIEAFKEYSVWNSCHTACLCIVIGWTRFPCWYFWHALARISDDDVVSNWLFHFLLGSNLVNQYSHLKHTLIGSIIIFWTFTAVKSNGKSIRWLNCCAKNETLSANADGEVKKSIGLSLSPEFWIPVDTKLDITGHCLNLIWKALG